MLSRKARSKSQRCGETLKVSTIRFPSAWSTSQTSSIPALCQGLVIVSLLSRGGILSAKGAKANFEMTVWRPALTQGISESAGLGKEARKQAYQPLDFLRTFRNRIAHHEAIFERDLRRDYEKIVRVPGWISPEARAWIEEHSHVPELLVAPEDISMKFCR